MNAVPNELLMALARALASSQKREVAPPTIEQLAVHFRQSPDVIKRAFGVLKARELQNVSRAPSGRTNPGRSQRLNPVGNAVNSLLRATVQTFRSDLKLDLLLGEQAFRHDQVTTEDFSVYVQITGALEGSVCFGVSRQAARHLIGVVARRRIGSVDSSSLLILNRLVDRIMNRTRSHLDQNGHPIFTSPASTIYPSGMKITTLGMPQCVANLRSKFGPVVVHAVLAETSGHNRLAA